MVIDAEKRALINLSYILYLKRTKRHQQGNAMNDWKRAEKILQFCKQRIDLIEKIMDRRNNE